MCAKTEYFFVIGKSLELRPLPGVANIESIAWRHKGNFVAEWAKDKIPLEIYPAFKGRTTLDIKTGHLKIDRMTAGDTGEFSVEINSNKLDERYIATAIEEVPVPYVWVNPNGENWRLSCEGNVENAGDVTYFWHIGGGDQNWTKGENAVLISNNKTTRVIETFSCKIKNPVSEKESEPQKNPFYDNGSGNSGVVVGVVVTLVILLILVIGIVCWKKWKEIRDLWSSWFSGNRTVNPDDNHEGATPLNDQGADKTNDREGP